MRRSVRVASVVWVVALGAAAVAPPAGAERVRATRPRMRVATAVEVHGRDAGGSQLRASSFDRFAPGRRADAGSPAARPPSAPSTAGAPSVALGFDALSDPTAFPADPHGAIGDDWIVAVVNTQLGVYDRAGVPALPAPVPLEALHEETAGAFVFDPKAVYDQYHDVFVVVYLTQGDAPKRSTIVVVAIPNATADDAGTWCSTAFDGDLIPGGAELWADYPGLGYTPSRVTITTNQFTFPSFAGRFRYAQVLSLDAATLYDCATPTPEAVVFGGTQTRAPNGAPAFTIQPAQTVDATGGPQLLLSVEVLGKGSYLVVWKVKAPADGLKLRRVIVPVGRAPFPISGTQAGGTVDDGDTFWDTGDGRLVNAFYDADDRELYAAHNVAKDVRPDPDLFYIESVARWYEVRPGRALKDSAVERRGTVGAPGVDVGWPSVATDTAGNLFVAYSRAGAVTGEFLSAWVAEVAPTGSAATQLLLRAGTATYDAVPGPERWGDYTAAVRDPVTGGVATFNQAAVASDAWQQVVHLLAHAA